MASRAAAEGVFTLGEAPRLIGGRRRDTGKIVFPLPQGAEGACYETVQLRPDGHLWSYTVQRFPPPSPPAAPSTERFVPFAVGYVELDGELIVEGRLLVSDFSALRIGQEMRVTTTVFARAPDGTDLVTYAFAPV
jgi:uncharacterized OB-fold protein